MIVIEGEQGDDFSQNMLDYFKVGGKADNEKKPQGLVNNKMQPAEDIEGACRICLGEEDDPSGNPLFSPCMCAGSMGLIHLQCLREWLRQRKI